MSGLLVKKERTGKGRRRESSRKRTGGKEEEKEGASGHDQAQHL